MTHASYPYLARRGSRYIYRRPVSRALVHHPEFAGFAAASNIAVNKDFTILLNLDTRDHSTAVERWHAVNPLVSAFLTAANDRFNPKTPSWRVIGATAWINPAGQITGGSPVFTLAPPEPGEIVESPVAEIAAPSPATNTTIGEALTWSEVIEDWALERKIARPEVRTYSRMAGRLIETVGCDDMTKVTSEHVTAHKKALRASGLDEKTIENHLTALRTLFNHAIKNPQHDRPKITGNPVGSFTAQKNGHDARIDFSDADRALILAKARECQDPVIRICNLIAGYSGARLAEICEASTKDFERIDGILCFSVQYENRSPSCRIKTADSPRRVPLHPAIAGEVQAYLDSIPEGDLFPSLPHDRDGRKSNGASRRIGAWLRPLIPDTRKVFHSWRHHVETRLANALVPDRVAFRITGRAISGTVANYLHQPPKPLLEALEKAL
jgi:integrase